MEKSFESSSCCTFDCALDFISINCLAARRYEARFQARRGGGLRRRHHPNDTTAPGVNCTRPPLVT